jgi:hypothetical protein
MPIAAVPFQVLRAKCPITVLTNYCRTYLILAYFSFEKGLLNEAWTLVASEKLPRKGRVFGAIVCSGAAFRSSPKVKGKNIFDMWWSELWPPGHERLTVTAQYRVLFNRCWPIDCVF